MTALRERLTALGVQVSRPTAFLVFFCYVAAWLIFAPQSVDWHAVATLATWLMTLFIQRAEHRDTQAIHAKLDVLLRVDNSARNELTSVDEREPEEIERHRKAARASLGNTNGQTKKDSRRESRAEEKA